MIRVYGGGPVEVTTIRTQFLTQVIAPCAAVAAQLLPVMAELKNDGGELEAPRNPDDVSHHGVDDEQHVCKLFKSDGSVCSACFDSRMLSTHQHVTKGGQRAARCF